jgi:hypothetical protein
MDRRKNSNPADADRLTAELLCEFGSGMNERAGRIILDNNLIECALGLAMHPDPRAAFRSSWALDWAYFHDREAILPHAERLIDTFIEATNGSVHRQYSKIIYDMYHTRIVAVDGIRLARIAEKAFDLLIDTSTRTAVKVWCMELLFDIAPRVEWVGEQLGLTLRQMMESEPSRGLANRAAKVLKRM